VLIEVSPRRMVGQASALETLGIPVRSDAPRDAGGLDGAVAARLSELADGELPASAGESVVLHGDGLRVVAAGVGEGRDPDDVRWAAAALAKVVSHIGGRVGWALDPALPLPVAAQATAVVEGLLLGGYDPGRWKGDADRREPEALVLLTDEDAEAVRAAAERAGIVARWANRARDLANEPPNSLTPAALAAHAESFAAEREHLTASALGPDEVAELGMGAFGGVAAGSHNPARMIVMRYDPPGAVEDVVLGLVGKAITFDTGGISLKPALYMEDMKGDMAGGGAVVAGMAAIAELGLPVRAIAVVAATENMPGGGAYRPGDILRAANGKTIEVVNTDAEGRIVLADALWYARREGATHIVDLATLTGTMEKALGDVHAGVYGAPDEWRDEVVAAGEASGDHAWPFPLHPRYRRFIDSDYADVKNSNVRGQAGPGYAAEFLRLFAGEGPWAHIDMAGTGFFTWSRGDYLWQRGGTGYGVRLIAELARRLSA
jgi:leucyl aminopeptidase